MIQIDKLLIEELFKKASESERKRMNYDLRTSPEDNSQRMLNALLPGTEVPIHRHPQSTETVFLLRGKMVEILYEDPLLSPLEGDDVFSRLVEKERILLDPSAGSFGCVVPAGVWHTVEVLEPSVIFESKDGKYGEDGSEAYSKTNDTLQNNNDTASSAIGEGRANELSFSNCLGDLKKNIEYLIGMERQSGSMDVITPLYVSRMLNVPIEDVEKVMKEME